MIGNAKINMFPKIAKNSDDSSGFNLIIKLIEKTIDWSAKCYPVWREDSKKVEEHATSCLR